ncbi:S1 family peptidase [Burkholderia cepacia]|uniref:S1 family peptidase n=1 Tax=Burkholderia cepacia TaxID=292 RepID=UPI0009BCC682|nr:serine protease [Burkholderia cepacia]
MLRKTASTHANGVLLLLRVNASNTSVEGIGSAFLAHRAGYLVTCAHTFNLTDELGIAVPFRGEGFVPMSLKECDVAKVKVAQYDAVHDVALLKLPDGTTAMMPQLSFMSDRDVQLGASAACIGYPFCSRGLHTRHISSATVSAKVLSENGTKQFQLDATIHDGNSGGPLIDVQTNRVFGIVSGRFAPNNGFAGVAVGGFIPGTDSAIAYGTSIAYALDLLRAEGLDVQ